MSGMTLMEKESLVTELTNPDIDLSSKEKLLVQFIHARMRRRAKDLKLDNQIASHIFTQLGLHLIQMIQMTPTPEPNFELIFLILRAANSLGALNSVLNEITTPKPLSFSAEKHCQNMAIFLGAITQYWQEARLHFQQSLLDPLELLLGEAADSSREFQNLLAEKENILIPITVHINLLKIPSVYQETDFPEIPPIMAHFFGSWKALIQSQLLNYSAPLFSPSILTHLEGRGFDSLMREFPFPEINIKKYVEFLVENQRFIEIRNVLRYTQHLGICEEIRSYEIVEINERDDKVLSTYLSFCFLLKTKLDQRPKGQSDNIEKLLHFFDLLKDKINHDKGRLERTLRHTFNTFLRDQKDSPAKRGHEAYENLVTIELMPCISGSGYKFEKAVIAICRNFSSLAHLLEEHTMRYSAITTFFKNMQLPAEFSAREIRIIFQSLALFYTYDSPPKDLPPPTILISKISRGDVDMGDINDYLSSLWADLKKSNLDYFHTGSKKPISIRGTEPFEILSSEKKSKIYSTDRETLIHKEQARFFSQTVISSILNQDEAVQKQVLTWLLSAQQDSKIQACSLDFLFSDSVFLNPEFLGKPGGHLFLLNLLSEIALKEHAGLRAPIDILLEGPASTVPLTRIEMAALEKMKKSLAPYFDKSKLPMTILEKYRSHAERDSDFFYLLQRMCQSKVLDIEAYIRDCIENSHGMMEVCFKKIDFCLRLMGEPSQTDIDALVKNKDLGLLGVILQIRPSIGRFFSRRLIIEIVDKMRLVIDSEGNFQEPSFTFKTRTAGLALLSLYFMNHPKNNLETLLPNPEDYPVPHAFGLEIASDIDLIKKIMASIDTPEGLIKLQTLCPDKTRILAHEKYKSLKIALEQSRSILEALDYLLNSLSDECLIGGDRHQAILAYIRSFLPESSKAYLGGSLDTNDGSPSRLLRILKAVQLILQYQEASSVRTLLPPRMPFSSLGRPESRARLASRAMIQGDPEGDPGRLMAHYQKIQTAIQSLYSSPSKHCLFRLTAQSNLGLQNLIAKLIKYHQEWTFKALDVACIERGIGSGLELPFKIKEIEHLMNSIPSTTPSGLALRDRLLLREEFRRMESTEDFNFRGARSSIVGPYPAPMFQDKNPRKIYDLLAKKLRSKANLDSFHEKSKDFLFRLEAAPSFEDSIRILTEETSKITKPGIRYQAFCDILNLEDKDASKFEKNIHTIRLRMYAVCRLYQISCDLSPEQEDAIYRPTPELEKEIASSLRSAVDIPPRRTPKRSALMWSSYAAVGILPMDFQSYGGAP